MKKPVVLRQSAQPSSNGKPAAVKFKTSTRKDGREVHTYAGGRKVVLKASVKAASTPGAPVAPVDPYGASVDAAARQKYDPVQKALGAQQDAQANRAGDIGAWYDRYKQAVAQATASNQQASTQAVQSLGALGGAATTSDAAQRAQIAQQQGGDAAARGASVDPAVLAQMAQGSNVRGTNLAGQQAVQIGQGVQQTALDQQKNVAGEGTRVASMLDNAARMRELQGKGTDLQREIGDFKISQRASLVDADQKARLEQYLATGKLENDAAKTQVAATVAQVTARDKAQNRSIKRSGQRLTAAQKADQLRIQQQNADANTTRANKPAAGPKAKSPYLGSGPQGKKADTINSALGYARTLRSQNISRHDAAQYLLSGQKASDAPLYKTLKDKKTGKTTQVRVLNPDGTPATKTAGRNIPSYEKETLALSVALDVAYDGHISRANVKRLHAAGIKVNSLGFPTKAPPKSKSPFAGAKATGTIANGNPGR